MKKLQKTTNNKSILHKLSCVMTVFMLIQIIAVYSPVMAEEVNPATSDKSIVAIGGTKVVEGEAPKGTFTFTLTQVTDASGSDYTSSGITRNTTVATQAQSIGEKKYTFIFDDMQLADGEYYFEIKETYGQGWTSSDQPYIIYVKVSSGLVTIVNAEDLPIPPNTDVNDLTWIPPGVHPNLPWGSANYFSVLTFGNFSASGSDVESGLAVGGDLHIGGGGYSVGKTGPSYNAGHPIAPHNPRLLVKGSILAEANLIAFGGSIVVSEASDVSDYVWTRKYKGTSPFYAPSVPALSQGDPNFENSVRSFTKESDDTVSDFFSNAYNDMIKLSKDYKDLTDGNGVKVIDVSTGTASAEIEEDTYVDILRFDDGPDGVFPQGPQGDEYKLYHTIVYNLTLNNFPGTEAEIRSTYFTIPDDYNGNIIINVLPGENESEVAITKLLINGGAEHIDTAADNASNPIKGDRDSMRKYSDHIIWNFPSEDLTKIKTQSREIIGSVLAPYADLDVTGGGVNGTLVAKSVASAFGSGWETHSTTYFGRVQVNTNKIEFTNTYDTIPTTGDNSIIVHKYLVDDLNDYTIPGDGRELNTGKLGELFDKRLKDITFTLYSFTSPPTGSFPEYTDIKVIDSGGSKVLTLYNNEATAIATYPLTYERVGTTGPDGIATFSNLPDGYYVVVEELDPYGRVNAAILPFIVQLPLYNATNPGGLKDVHVYPKNESKKGGDKFPDTGGIGSVIFTVTGVVMLSGSLVALTLADKKSKSGRAKK